MIYNLSQYNIHWKTKRLNQLGVFSRGKSKHRPRDDYRLFINGKYPLIQTSDIKKANLYVTSHVQEYNEFGLQQSKLWNKGTLCITIAANIADTAIISYPMCFPDSVVGFLANKNESSELFMHYIFKYIQNNIKKTVRGSIQDNININYLEQLYFKIPEKAYQNKIVLILSSIDKKIELNNKINTELEAMAKTIYDYWFLQFEFPNEEGKPYKSSGGKMVWNEELKREIPEGWEVRTLENLGNLIMGQSPKSTSYNNKKEGLPLINGAAELQKDKIEVTKYTSEPTRICKEKDLIFCIRATIGNINYADKSYCLGRGVGAFRVTEKEYVEYMFLTLRNILNMYNKILTGSIIVGITKEDLLQQNIVKPKNDVITQFYNKVHFMAEKMKSIKKENQELTALRDFLLPLLMNGQVGFKEDKAEG